MKRKEVVLTKETRQKEFVKKVMNSISNHISLQPSDKVAIKIDLSGSKEIYANTHYETVESLIFYLKERFGVSDISVIEGSDGAYYSGKTTWDIFYKFRYKEVELNGAKLVNLDEQPHDHKMEIMTLSGPREIKYTKYEADYVISVVPPKTHHIFPVTLSIPSITGYVHPEDRALLMGTSNTEFKKFNFSNTDRFIQLIDNAGKNLTQLLKELKPSMVIIDGLYGMEGKGPIKGSPVFHGFAVASEDIVLADALTTYLMGFEVDQVAYLTYAYQEGVGNNRWQNVTGVDPCHVKFPYRPHPLFQKQRLWKEFYQTRRDGGNPNKYNKHGQSRYQDKHGKYRKPYKTNNIEKNPRYQNARDNKKEN
ncbi:MAG: DUF362 domain-containing protein [bacterium]|nr:DUF362 domain-containing protein [bacterium]